MTIGEGLGILVMWAYLMGFMVLTATAAKKAGRPVWLFGVGKERQALPALLFRLTFIFGAIYPPLWEAWSIYSGRTQLWSSLHDGTLEIFGLLVMAIGVVLALAAQRHMGASWRIGAAEGHQGAIVDDGPFAISRNPVFVGQALLFIGSLAVFPSEPQAVAVAALLAAIHLQVVIEERVLAAELGQPYADYKLRVRRWL
ncbi:isoprenylcysteine carboxylmethyltransferase family protein [Rhizobium sp. FKL33]|uniref:methyltransferase family protein n=1 Tax=Rhizobium sp. FKL33 TaxID=2562307 RepID=UPI0010BFB9D0|nr:isoprenylcysteine carboxylmethyltransferase family protein [Rhizobium sp. FKL33]